MYAIWRIYYPVLQKEDKYIKTVLTEGEAQAHCSSPETRVEGKYYDTYRKDIE